MSETLPERIDSVPYLKGHFAGLIYNYCHGDDIDCVLKKLGACKTPTELAESIRACCRNARAGQTLDNGYVVATVNSRAAKSLLSLMIDRPQYLQHLSTEKIQHHIDRMDAARSHT
jgi:hypothetical protein